MFPLVKKIDWYVLKKFFTTFFFTILSTALITVVIDSSEKADDFVKTGLSTPQIISKYYSGFVPHILSLIFPIIVFISVILFASKMASRSEVIAVLASGISFRRFLWPFALGGMLLGALLWFSNRQVVPRANEIRANFQAKYIDANSSYNQSLSGDNQYYFREDSFTYIGIRFYDTTTRSASGFFLERIDKNRVVYNLRAESIKWDESSKLWRLENAVERTINGIKETAKLYPSLSLGLNLRPKDLRKDEYLKDKLTTPELSEFIRMEILRGAEGLNTLKVERYRRDASAFAVLILVLIAAIFSSRRIRGGTGMHLAMGVVIGFIFIMMDRFSTVFSVKGNFPPLLAAWTPNIIFALIAVWLYRRAPK